MKLSKCRMRTSCGWPKWVGFRSNQTPKRQMSFQLLFMPCAAVNIAPSNRPESEASPPTVSTLRSRAHYERPGNHVCLCAGRESWGSEKKCFDNFISFPIPKTPDRRRGRHDFRVAHNAHEIVERKRNEVIKVQNEDELRLAQMGRLPIPGD
jgi:hypothetical protein